ncbi:MAG: hypothetical protein EOP09_16240 [Proteobacteria bacterium]|nr:MAG: hypothetical protein EOP09_16240 [Pseudomonadota bacterium]
MVQVMLSLASVDAVCRLDVSFDEHVPFTLEFSPMAGEACYWRAICGADTMFEVGVTREGRPKSMTMVGINRELVTVSNELAPPSSVRSSFGCPIFDANYWANDKTSFDSNFVDENVALRFLISRYSMRLFIGESRVAVGLDMDRCRFLFDDKNDLCGLEIGRLSLSEIDMLLHSLA